MSYKVAKYLRLSSEDSDLSEEKRESNSITNQRHLLDDYICQMSTPDLEAIEYVDDGCSGTNFERPGVMRLLDDVRAGRVDCILVKDLSRFGRDYIMVSRYIFQIFPALGVRFVAVTDHFDSQDPTCLESLDPKFKNILNDYYSRDISGKIRSSFIARAKRGDFLSNYAIYGYKKDPADHHHLIIDPEAAEVVRRIFQMRAEGIGSGEIARRLNEDGIPTPMLYKIQHNCTRTDWRSIHRENVWERCTIDRMLCDERYLGIAVNGKKSRPVMGQNKAASQDRSKWYVVEGTHEPVISRELYDLAHSKRRKLPNRNSAAGKSSLNGLVFCGLCGHALKRQYLTETYCCKTREVTDVYGCPRQRIPESELLAAVQSGLQVQAGLALVLDQCQKELQAEQESRSLERAEMIRQKRDALDRIRHRSTSLYEDFVFDRINRGEYVQRKKELDASRDELLDELKKLESKPEPILENRFVEVFKECIDIQELTPEIISSTLRAIRVFPDKKLVIEWKYHNEFAELLSSMERAGKIIPEQLL